MIFNRVTNRKKLRVIRTARSLFKINFAIKFGYYPLVKAVEPSDNIKSKFAILQHKKTGNIQVISDYRSEMTNSDSEEYEIVINWTYYYPYHFKLPFAAYLIPKNIKVGELVFVKDLIEDYIGFEWNQGNSLRLQSAEAIWDGTDLIIQYDRNQSVRRVVG
jgi:hypothetical protein